jgi:pimeloyl-ACP methyl ester carboxylesterase
VDSGVLGELRLFQVTLGSSIPLVRLLQPDMPLLTANPVTRTMLLFRLSARPWSLRRDIALQEPRSLADSPSFDEVQHALVHGPLQEGAPAGSTPGPVVIGWGRTDRLTLPPRAQRAVDPFPDARLEWFDRSGHFPHWDRPEATVRLTLAATS